MEENSYNPVKTKKQIRTTILICQKNSISETYYLTNQPCNYIRLHGSLPEEKYDIKKAHFHWFKGDLQTISRLIDNDYFISITPDVIYEKEIQELVRLYPIEKMMVETDGPWPFEGPFKGRITHPNMIHSSINMISEIKQLPSDDVYRQLYINTTSFYHL